LQFYILLKKLSLNFSDFLPCSDQLKLFSIEGTFNGLREQKQVTKEIRTIGKPQVVNLKMATCLKIKINFNIEFCRLQISVIFQVQSEYDNFPGKAMKIYPSKKLFFFAAV
jgi:predicted transport protein